MTNPYKFALDVQDACNLGGVIRSLPVLLDAIQAEKPPAGVSARDHVAKHPAFILYLDKILDMVGREKAMGTDVFCKAYDACLGAERERLAVERYKAPGEWLEYSSAEHGTLCGGILAEIAKSPLTGKTRFRVVDFWREARDEGAGKWIDASCVINSVPEPGRMVS